MSSVGEVRDGLQRAAARMPTGRVLAARSQVRDANARLHAMLGSSSRPEVRRGLAALRQAEDALDDAAAAFTDAVRRCHAYAARW